MDLGLYFINYIHSIINGIIINVQACVLQGIIVNVFILFNPNRSNFMTHQIEYMHDAIFQFSYIFFVP